MDEEQYEELLSLMCIREASDLRLTLSQVKSKERKAELREVIEELLE